MESLWKVKTQAWGAGRLLFPSPLHWPQSITERNRSSDIPLGLGWGQKEKDRQKSSGACWSVLVVTGQVSMANLEHSSRGKKRAAWQDKWLTVPAASEQQPLHVWLRTAYLIPDQEAQGIYKGANGDLLRKAFDHRYGCAEEGVSSPHAQSLTNHLQHPALPQKSWNLLNNLSRYGESQTQFLFPCRQTLCLTLPRTRATED